MMAAQSSPRVSTTQPRGKRLLCLAPQGRRPDGTFWYCGGRVEWATTHVAFCPECHQTWWSQRPAHRWTAIQTDAYAAASAASEMARAMLTRKHSEAEADRLLTAALPRTR